MKIKQFILGMAACTLLITGCTDQTKGNVKIIASETTQGDTAYKGIEFTYQVIPETFQLTIQSNGEEVLASLPSEPRRVDNFQEKDDKITWNYPDDEIGVILEQKEDYLEVSITSYKHGENTFVWPRLQGESYMLPLREGKFIPKDDKYWKEHLEDAEMDIMESLSMSFFGVNHPSYNVLYIIEDLFHSEIKFDAEEAIKFDVEHTYTSIAEDKSYSFRIYVTENDPVDIAKIYKNYKIEKGEFQTLEDKAKANPNIEKLYGASHVYLWDEAVIAEENINWQALRESMDTEAMTWIKTLWVDTEMGRSALEVLEQLKHQDYVDNYQKGVLCQALSEVLRYPDFYNPLYLPESNKEMQKLLEKGLDTLNQVEEIQLNKYALQVNMPKVFKPIDEWADSRGVDILKDMKANGIDNLWIGLNHWEQGFIKPELVTEAVANGYLIGPYDSYHSIHKPGEEQWHTAVFKDTSLFEKATVINQAGNFEKGFQGVGRKLNPTLSLEAVQARIGELISLGVPFNTWFVDCDATGEIYDDYSEEHITTKQKDLEARLERMAYIREEAGMVIGSEGGNDFASTTIALAHGIELPSFSWMDEDMKSNKESEYYLGRWYSPKGGVLEKFAEPVPVKEVYKQLFLEMAYTIPLYKLVYNDAMITTYHWDWPTFKIKGEVGDRMLYEILYNVPPLYHLDKWEWEKYKEPIIEHSNVYEDFSKQVINKPMTDFKILSEDRLVQLTEYGEVIRVVANFKDEAFDYEGDKIAPHSLIIYSGNEKIVYQR